MSRFPDDLDPLGLEGLTAFRMYTVEENDLHFAGPDRTATVPGLEWRPADRFAEHDNAPALQLVLDAGADPDALRGDGWNARADTAEAGASACATVLVEAGADPTRRFDGATAADLAAAHGHHELAVHLAAHRDTGTCCPMSGA